MKNINNYLTIFTQELDRTQNLTKAVEAVATDAESKNCDCKNCNCVTQAMTDHRSGRPFNPDEKRRPRRSERGTAPESRRGSYHQHKARRRGSAE